jgi:hypothetical protein
MPHFMWVSEGTKLLVRVSVLPFATKISRNLLSLAAHVAKKVKQAFESGLLNQGIALAPRSAIDLADTIISLPLHSSKVGMRSTGISA